MMDASELDALLGGSEAEREESWRYSRNALRALTQQAFAAADAAAELPADLRQQFDWPETRGARLVFVNGAYSARHSDSPAGVEIEARNARTILRLRDGARVHLIHASVPAAAPSRWQGDLDVDLPSGRATLIEQHVGASGADVFGAVTARYTLGADAELRTITLTDLPDSVSLIARQQVRVAGTWRATHALFGGRLQRLDLDCELTAQHARCTQRGMFVPRARQHIDVHLDVRHAARDTASDVLWRGVADQRGRGILRGAITVAEGADGADAQLQTRNLLLSPHAEIDAQPVLEIYADEVKASHGATVGQLDERA
jgi:Fe-S cluster assembly protein SufD